MNPFEFLLALGYAEPSMVEETINRAYRKADATQRRRRKILRTLLIAAVITTLLAAAAYAANVLFNMRLTNNDKTLTQEFGGTIAHYEDIGLVISFDGPDMCHQAGFKANYLPSEPSHLLRYPDDEWYAYLNNEYDENGEMRGPVAYNIGTHAASTKTSLMIGGKTEIVKEYSSDNLHIFEITSDYTGTEFERDGINGANFIILFDSENGYIIRICSNMYSLEELEKVLANMELYIYRETYTPKKDLDYGFINPGRG